MITLSVESEVDEKFIYLSFNCTVKKKKVNNERSGCCQIVILHFFCVCHTAGQNNVWIVVLQKSNLKC